MERLLAVLLKAALTWVFFGFPIYYFFGLGGLAVYSTCLGVIHLLPDSKNRN